MILLGYAVLLLDCVVSYNISLLNPNHLVHNKLHGVMYRKKAVFAINISVICTYPRLATFTQPSRQYTVDVLSASNVGRYTRDEYVPISALSSLAELFVECCVLIGQLRHKCIPRK